MAHLAFTKMHGIGNDFVLVDTVNEPLNLDWPGVSRFVCERRYGVGADGLILAEREDDRLRMRMFNPDGSESEMCGNGVRCFAIFARDRGLATGNVIPVETGAGRLVLEVLEDGRVKVDMGRARLKPVEIGMSSDGESWINQPIEALETVFRGTAVSMGNPHLVLLVPDASVYDLAKYGPVLEHHELFPHRVNVHFVQVIDRGHIIQRTWERGAGITLACGTGACASAVAAFVNGQVDRNVVVRLPGGELEIEYGEDGTVLMTGSATEVFTGVVAV